MSKKSKIVTTEKLRKQTDTELERLLRKTQTELKELQLGLSKKESKSPNNLQPQRKLIARIKTVLQEKRFLKIIEAKKVKN